MTPLAGILLAVSVLALGCERSGIESLPPHLRPAPESRIDFYRLGTLRCPYWISTFQTQDGRQGGGACVNRETLKEVCAAATCEAKTGRPPTAIE